MVFTLVVTEKGGTPRRLEFDKDEVTIGRVPGNDVILPKGNVSKRHSRIVRQDGRFFVVDLKSTNGTYLNGRRITTPSAIRPSDKVYVGDFMVMLEMGDAAANRGAAEEAEPIDDDAIPASLQVPEPGPSRSSTIAGDGIDRVPLDEEPPESVPPPRAPSTAMQPAAQPPAQPNAQTVGPPRLGKMTQPIGSGDAAAAAAAQSTLGGVGSGPNAQRPTQPPPRLSASGAGARGSQASVPSQQSASSPRPSGAGQRAPSTAAMPAQAPLGGPPRLTPSRDMPPAQPPPATNAQGFEPMEAVLPAAHPAPSSAIPPPAAPPAAREPAPTGGDVSTLNVPSSTVNAVIASHRAAAVANEPVPPGREYARLLGDVAGDARSNGAIAAADRMADANARAKVRGVVESVVRKRGALPAGITAERLVRDATAEIAGAGALETALEEPDVSTVIVEPGGRVLVGRADAAGPSPFWFSSEAAVISAVDRLLHAAGASRANGPMVQATLPDGAQLVAVLPPAALAGASVIVERAPARAATLVDLTARQMLSQAAATLLGHALAARRNIVVSGPRGSGRSTVAAALVASIAPTDRVVAIEDRREVSRARGDVAGVDASGDWRRAVEIGVRLRPHRLVLGDCNEATASAFVGGAATGAEGSILVAEGASPALALQRVAALASGTGVLSREDAIQRLATTRPIVVHVARLGDGVCRVVSIGEARLGDGGALQVDETFVIRIEGPDADGRLETSLASTGVVPRFAQSV